jgi:hypothetical protein
MSSVDLDIRGCSVTRQGGLEGPSGLGSGGDGVRLRRLLRGDRFLETMTICSIFFNFRRELPEYPKARQDHPSKGHRLNKYTISHTFSQTAIAHHIYLDAQELFKFLYQSGMPKQSRTSLKLYQ